MKQLKVASVHLVSGLMHLKTVSFVVMVFHQSTVTVQLVQITQSIMPILSSAYVRLVPWSIHKVFAYRSAPTMKYTMKGLLRVSAFKIWLE